MVGLDRCRKYRQYRVSIVGPSTPQYCLFYPGETVLTDIKQDRQSACNIIYSWFLAINALVE